MDKYEEILKKIFGFDHFRGHQGEIIKSIIEDKKDICAILFTGAGKSLCYQFPPIYIKSTALIISPLIALMNDQKMKLDKLNINSLCLNSTNIMWNSTIDDIMENQYRIIYTTPEYIVNDNNRKIMLDLSKKNIICTIAIDEAHCVSSWGNDFRSDYKKLSCLKDIFPNVPLLALTATATKKVQDDIINILKLKNYSLIKSSFDRPNLYISVKQKTNNIHNDIFELLDNNDASIIYCQTRQETEKNAKILNDMGIKCRSYHAGMRNNDREEIHKLFVDNEIDCIVATVAFGMGIDKPIKTVIHYGAPKDIESYYQEIGRAGRDGTNSYCYLFYSQSDINANAFFINNTENKFYRERKMEMLSYMKQYIDTKKCRRRIILEYFGEKYNKENCGNCDNCMKTGDVLQCDFTKESILVLQVIKNLRFKFGVNKIISILRGSNNKSIHENIKKLSIYGKGNYKHEKWWKILCRILINNNYLKEESIHGGHGFCVSMTKKGKNWLSDVSDDNFILENNNKKLIFDVPDDMMEFYEIKNKKSDDITNDKKNKKTDKNILCNDVNNKKQKSADETIRLLKSGLPIEEIAKERNISEITVESHILSNYELNLDKLLNYTYKKHIIISNILNNINYKDMRLRDIKRKVPPNTSYLDINICILKKDLMTLNNFNMYLNKIENYVSEFKYNYDECTQKYNNIIKNKI